MYVPLTRFSGAEKVFHPEKFEAFDSEKCR